MAHLHGLYCIMGLLDGVNFQPLCCVRQKKLVDDLYLIIRGLDGSEGLSSHRDTSKRSRLG